MLTEQQIPTPGTLEYRRTGSTRQMCIRDRTYFAMRLAAACTNRKPLHGMETLEPFNFIYQTAEDGLGDTVKPRLMEAMKSQPQKIINQESGSNPGKMMPVRAKLLRQPGILLKIIQQ